MLPGVTNEVAIISTPTCISTLVIYTGDCRDYRPDPDNAGALLPAGVLCGFARPLGLVETKLAAEKPS